MKVFLTMYETGANDIKDKFGSFIAILKERKEVALKQAPVDADAVKFDGANPDPLKIDTAKCEGRINRCNCGTSIGESCRIMVNNCELENRNIMYRPTIMVN